MVYLYPQTQHSLIPKIESDENNLELARETKSFRQEFFQLLGQKVQEISASYTNAEDPEKIYRGVRRELDSIPEVKAAHQRRRELQDRLWSRVAMDLESDRERLTSAFEASFERENRGKLELNSDFNYPLHQLKADIHRMPGGYLKDTAQEDFWTGAVYDHGVFLYGQGWFGGLNDELGHTLIHHVLDSHYPKFVPQTILDMGCSVGHSTLPYKEKYPQARVWGIELGASLLRYASARAKALNQTIYFAQQNAEQTEFTNRSFDLVVSHILLHEIPCGARKRVFAESYRLLKPGGIMIHLESQLFLSPPSLVARYFRDTEVWVNSEPYLGSSKLADFPSYALAAGFEPENFVIHRVPGYFARQKGNNNPGWIAMCGHKL
jgi:SAM-dependent methyltransferase